MARPIKVNLDFFPFDVKFFADEKLDDVQNEYGPLGEAIYLRLLCFIYGNKGYYYESFLIWLSVTSFQKSSCEITY